MKNDCISEKLYQFSGLHILQPSRSQGFDTQLAQNVGFSVCFFLNTIHHLQPLAGQTRPICRPGRFSVIWTPFYTIQKPKLRKSNKIQISNLIFKKQGPSYHKQNQIEKISKTENGQGRGNCGSDTKCQTKPLTCDITNYKRNTSY